MAVASGIFGVGGPLLTVPLLVAIGTPILPALAAAQAQSIIISIVGSVGYFSIGAIDWGLALIVGIPEMCGVLIGWKVARAVPARYLKWTMIIILIAIAPVLALTDNIRTEEEPASATSGGLPPPRFQSRAPMGSPHG